MKAVNERLGLRINAAKTKVMVVDRAESLPNFTALGEYEKVNTFVYLGSTIESDGGSSTEIRRRIVLGKAAMTRQWNVTCRRNVSRGKRKRLIRLLVFFVFDAFEMWVWRKMLRIPWTARRTNVSIVNELDEPIRLSALCERCKLGYFGNTIMRREDGNLEKYILFGKAPSRGGRVRSPTWWSDTIRAEMGSVVGAAKEAQDRDR